MLSTNSKNRVLVVEDSKSQMLHYQRIYDEKSFDVDFATDGKDAWRLFQENRYDLVISDNNMPKMTGIELLQAIRNFNDSRANTPFIFVSGDDHLDCDRNTYTESFCKPPDFKQIFTLIDKTLSSNKPKVAEELGRQREAAMKTMKKVKRRKARKDTNNKTEITSKNASKL